MSNKENYKNKFMNLTLIKSQHKEIFNLKKYVKNEFGFNLDGTKLVKIAINELITKNKDHEEIKLLLEKCHYI
jgi:hypothetical protein